MTKTMQRARALCWIGYKGLSMEVAMRGVCLDCASGAPQVRA